MSFIKQLQVVSYTLIFLFLSSQGYAQFKKIKLGKITDEYKNYSACDFAPGSGAVILKKDGHSYFDFVGDGPVTYFISHKIIKILNKDGLDAANIEFTTPGSVTKVKGITYNKNGKEWEETTFAKKDLFKEKVEGRRGIYNYKIPMPNVSEGSIIEVLLEIEHKSAMFIPNWYFQDRHPVVSSTYRTAYPNDFIFAQRLVSNYPVDIHNKEEITQIFQSMSFKSLIYGFTCKNIPPLNTKERYSPAPNFYSSHIEFNMTGVNSAVFRNQKFGLDSYKDFTAELLKSDGFGGYIKDNKGILAKLGVEITAGDDNNNAKAIYKKIQEKIKWDEYYYLFPDKSPEKTIKEGTGSVPDINMLLVSALREAKLKAFPVVSSTRRNGKAHPTVPVPNSLNYLLCVVDINGKNILLDASRKELPFGMLPYSTLNGNGYIIDQVRQGWIPLQEKAIHEEIYVANLAIEDDVIKGSLMSKLGKYGAYNYYYAEDDEELKEFQDKFKDGIATDWEWEECNFNDIESGKAVTNKGVVSKEIDSDDLIYIEPSLFQIFDENPFKEKERINPVDIPYRIKYKLLYNLKIPEGYSIEESPSSSKISLPDDGGKFLYVIEEKSNKISINITFDLKKMYFSVEEYPILYEFFGRVHEQMENMIVLKKI